MLTPAELAHAASILEPATLKPIPPKQIPKVLIASVVRKPPQVLNAFFQSLLWQDAKAERSYLFVNNFSLGDRFADEAKAQYSAFPVGTDINVGDAPAPDGDYQDSNAGRTRGWTPQAWHRIGAIKNQLIQRALDTHADYLWLIDADVLCDPYTLQSMLDSQSPIVSAVYWTQWTKPQEGDASVQHAGPQVWLRHPYTLSGRGYSEPEFRAALIGRKRLRVWGLGACTLIRRDALEKGVSFEKFADLPPGPMSDGEDRHFCIRADAMHLDMHADAWPDIWHAYHPSEYDLIPQKMEELSSRRALRHVKPKLSWLVSAKIENLDVPGLPPQWVRGQIGKLKVLPEIEETLTNLLPGESKVMKVHYPAHHPHDSRGHNFILKISLLDCKPFRHPMVVEDELFTAPNSFSYLDHTTLTQAQIQSIVQEAA